MSKNEQGGDFRPDVIVTNAKGGTVTTREYLGEDGKRMIKIKISKPVRGGGR